MDFTNDDIASLGDKLAALDLTPGETEALRTIVAMAADTGDDDEVSGFAVDIFLHLSNNFADLGGPVWSKTSPSTDRTGPRPDGFISFGDPIGT